MITKAEIEIHDSTNIFGVIAAFPEQIKQAIDIGSNIDIELDVSGIKNIIITGLGGSAIGGDLLRSYLQYEIKVPVQLNRNYYIPAYANEHTLVIASSYSGDTEETVSAYNDAKSKGCKIVCISAGGNLTVMAENDKNFVVKVPRGYQPRCALAFSFFTMLLFFIKLKFIASRDEDIQKVIERMKEKSGIYSDLQTQPNPAVKIAEHLNGRIPIIYSSNDLLDVVNLRWRGQFAENAKTLAFGNYFPELNHNEIVGWQENSDFLRNFALIYLLDREDNPRILKRQKITKEILEPYRGIDIEIESEGSSKLERIFDLIYLGDWISFYLAVINKVDPAPIEKINILKNKLMES
ncbi:MAG: bifunctional phosphoglucose/phosphomannose isomerase [Ignavibacteria bacterium]